MGLFKKKQTNNLNPLTIYIADDNPIYLKQLAFYLNKVHGEKIHVESFPVSEVIEVKLEHGHHPDIIIMDNYLSEKYADASLGIDALEQIQAKYPQISLILHSANTNLLIEKSDHFICIPKKENAFDEISQIILKKLV